MINDTQKKATKVKKESGSWLAIFFGLFCFIAGLVLLNSQIIFSSHSTATTATVVGYEYHAVSKGCGSRPKIGFTTTNGEKITTVANNVGLCEPIANGTPMKIVYNSSNPTDAQKNSWGSMWGSPAAGLIIGAVFLLIGIDSFRVAHRKNLAIAQGMSTKAKPASVKLTAKQQAHVDAVIEKLKQEQNSK